MRFGLRIRGNPQLEVWWGSGSWPLLILASGAFAGLAFAGRVGMLWLVVASIVASFAEIFWTGLYWQHYYLMPMPCLAIVARAGAGELIERVGRRITERRWFRAVRAVSVLLTFGWLAGWLTMIQLREYLWLTPEQVCARQKSGNQWIALRELGRRLAVLQREDTKLF